MATERTSSRRADLIFSAIITLLGVGVIVESTRLSQLPAFDPLGPGGVPMALGVLLIVFALWIGCAALVGRGVGGGQRIFSGLEDQDDAGNGPLLWHRALIVYLISIAYLLVLSMREVDFLPATVVYMVVLLYYLGDRSLRSMPLAVLISFAGALALDQVFRRLLMVSLP